MLPAEQLIQTDVYQDWLTQPGQRPIVFQRAANYQIAVGTNPVPVANSSFQCDTMVFSVPAGGTTCFVGFGSAVTTSSGIPIIGGTAPTAISPENTREPWEVQRLLEAIAAMIAAERGYNSIGAYRAPRVVFDANDYFLVSTAAQTVAVMLFFVPEFQ
jgi:hypothetical protein